MRITRFELQLLESLWELGSASVRDIQERLPEKKRPAYTTVQTMIYRLEEKGAVRRVKKTGNAHIFEPAVTRKAVHRRLIGELLDVFGGSATPLMSHLIETGKLTLDDVRQAEKILAQKGRNHEQCGYLASFGIHAGGTYGHCGRVQLAPRKSGLDDTRCAGGSAEVRFAAIPLRVQALPWPTLCRSVALCRWCCRI